jgi:hypothetical protein
VGGDVASKISHLQTSCLSVRSGHSSLGSHACPAAPAYAREPLSELGPTAGLLLCQVSLEALRELDSVAKRVHERLRLKSSSRSSDAVACIKLHKYCIHSAQHSLVLGSPRPSILSTVYLSSDVLKLDEID